MCATYGKAGIVTLENKQVREILETKLFPTNDFEILPVLQGLPVLQLLK